MAGGVLILGTQKWKKKKLGGKKKTLPLGSLTTLSNYIDKWKIITIVSAMEKR